jgi:hypothetical protein
MDGTLRTVQGNNAKDENQGKNQYNDRVDLQSWALVGVKLYSQVSMASCP